MKSKVHQGLQIFQRGTKAISRLINVFLLVMFLLIGLQRFTPVFSEYSLKTILTGSMQDTMPQGSLILVKEIATDKLSAGDVISFRSSGETVTHRIKQVSTKKGERTFITQGDANAYADQMPVSEEAVLGQVIFGVPNIGSWLLRLKQPHGMLALLLALWTLYLGESLIDQIIEVINKKSEDDNYENA